MNNSNNLNNNRETFPNIFSESLETKLQKANETIKSLQAEVEVLKGVIFVVKEDLNVKNEQFDYLYASLRASRAHQEQDRDRTEQLLVDRVAALELDLRSRDAQLREVQDRLDRAVFNSLPPSSCTEFFTRLPMEVVQRVLLHMEPPGLCSVAMTCRQLASATNRRSFWRLAFLRRFGSALAVQDWQRQLESETEAEELSILSGWTPDKEPEEDVLGSHEATHASPACDWKRMFRRRFVVDSNWVRGRADVCTLQPGHTGTVTALQFSVTAAASSPTPPLSPTFSPNSLLSPRGSLLASASDDGSLILWGLAPAAGERVASSGETLSPPPALALAQLMQPPPIQPRARKLFGGDEPSLPPFSLSQPASSGAAELCSTGVSPVVSRGGLRGAERLRAFHGHGGPVWCLEFDEEADRLVSGSYDKTLKIWELGSGRCLRTLRGHDGWVSCLGLLRGEPDQRVVSGSWDATIRVWDMTSGANLLVLQLGVGNALHCLKWDQRRRLVGAGCRHLQLQLWDLNQGVQVGACAGHLKEVSALHMGDVWATGSADSTVKLWDPTTQVCEMTLRGHTHSVMAVQHDGHFRVVSGSYDKTIKIWDTRRPFEPVQTLDQHSAAIFALQFDGDKIISGDADHAIKIFRFNKNA